MACWPFIAACPYPTAASLAEGSPSFVSSRPNRQHHTEERLLLGGILFPKVGSCAILKIFLIYRLFGSRS